MEGGWPERGKAQGSATVRQEYCRHGHRASLLLGWWNFQSPYYSRHFLHHPQLTCSQTLRQLQRCGVQEDDRSSYKSNQEKGLSRTLHHPLEISVGGGPSAESRNSSYFAQGTVHYLFRGQGTYVQKEVEFSHFVELLHFEIKWHA